MNRFILLGSVVVVAGALGAYLYTGDRSAGGQGTGARQPGDAIVQVTVPETLTPEAQLGQRFFEAKCAACHGKNAAGVEGSGPPLVHRFYVPGHHADEAIFRAPALGVRSHHWNFGDMPPVKGITRAEVASIITYLRELQRANGIF